MSTRVLLAEDENAAREILEFYLNTVFEEVVVVKDGQEGLDTFRANSKKSSSFDLVITDIRMPKLDGMSMIEEIIKIVPDQKFIVVSAHKEEEDLLRSINLRALGYFIKPLNIDNVMEILKKAKEQILKDQEKQALSKSSSLEIGKNYTYNSHAQLLFYKNKLIKLTKKESNILNLLIENRGKMVPIDDFKLKVWNDLETSDSTFRAVMKRLRDKLEEDFIISFKGQGYTVQI